MGFILRLLILAAIAWLVYRLYKRVKAQLGAPSQPPVPGPQYEPMARCAQCGTHLPAKALSADGRCGRCSAPAP